MMLTNKENLRIASGSEVGGADREPVSLCQGMEDAELNTESHAYAVGALPAVRMRLKMFFLLPEKKMMGKSTYTEGVLKNRLSRILQLAHQVFRCR